MGITTTMPTPEEELEQKFGRRIFPHLPFRTTAPQRVRHTEQELTQFDDMYVADKRYVRIDPKTKQKLNEAKEFFWRIVSPITECLGADKRDVRLNFQIQKYWRSKKITVNQLFQSDDRAEPQKRAKEIPMPFCLKDEEGVIIETGERIIDASDFLEQFQAE